MTTQTGNCLPSEVLDATPKCALACLQQWVTDNYGRPSCQTASNLSYLCTSQTRSRLTLGEGGVQCMISSCGDIDTDAYKPVYRVCGSVADARPNLQGQITATISVTSTTSATVWAPDSSTSIPVATTTFNMNNGVTTDIGAQPTITDGTVSSVDGIQPTGQVASSSATASGSRSGMVAGAAVGSIAGAFGLIGLILLFCRRRRRDHRMRNSPKGKLEPILPGKESTYTSRDPSPEPKIGQAINTAVVTAAGTTNMSSPKAQVLPVPQAPRATRKRSFSPLDIKRDEGVKAQESVREIKPEDIGVACSPTETTAFTGRDRSMPSIQESPTLPPQNMHRASSSLLPAPILGRHGDSVILEPMVYGRSPKPNDSSDHVHTGKRPYSYQKEFDETRRILDDVEAQQQQDIETPTSQKSFLENARASIAGTIASIARSVSLKRSPTTPKTPTGAFKRKSVKKPNNAQYRPPTTPRYDNGNIPVDPPPFSLDSPTIHDVAKIQDSSFKPSVPPKFQDFKYGKLPALQSSFSKNVRSPILPQNNRPKKFFGTRLKDHGLSISTDKDEQSSPEEMAPAPLLIKKSGSQDLLHDGATYSEVVSSRPSISHSRNASGSSVRSGVKGHRTQNSRDLGLRSPENAQHYARKPLPAPSASGPLPPLAMRQPTPPVQNFLASFAMRQPTPPAPSSVATLSALKTQQSQAERPPLSHARSTPQLPMSASTISPMSATSRPLTGSSIYDDASLFSQSVTSPRGRPAFPSSKSSSTKVVSSSVFSTTQPASTPASGSTLSPVPVKSFIETTQSVKKGKSFLIDPSPVPETNIEARSKPQPPRRTSDIPPLTPPKTEFRNSKLPPPQNSPLPPVPPLIPMPLASKGEGKPIIPELKHLVTPPLGKTGMQKQEKGEANGLLKQPSQPQSPDSADPNRNSMTPKAVFTPKLTRGGDMLMTVQRPLTEVEAEKEG